MSHDLWFSWLSADNERLSAMMIKQEAASFSSIITTVTIQSNGAEGSNEYREEKQALEEYFETLSIVGIVDPVNLIY